MAAVHCEVKLYIIVSLFHALIVLCSNSAIWS